MKKPIVIWNSASAASAGIAAELLEIARRFDCRLMSPKSVEELTAIVDAARDEGETRIIAAGGDGTVSRLVNALGEHRRELDVGIVPLGTGNDLARALDIPLDDWELAFELAIQGQAVPVDLLQLEGLPGTCALNAVTGGLGAEVTAAVTRADKSTWGAFAYWMTAISSLPKLHPFETDLWLDDEHLERPLYGLTIANGRFIGGGYPISNQAELDDGWLDVLMIPVLPALELLAAGAGMALGWQSAGSGITVRRARRVAIRAMPLMPFSFDGEPVAPLDVVLRVVPSGWRVVPGSYAALAQNSEGDSTLES